VMDAGRLYHVTFLGLASLQFSGSACKTGKTRNE
jgi:hypothetical protein